MELKIRVSDYYSRMINDAKARYDKMDQNDKLDVGTLATIGEIVLAGLQ